MYVRKQTFKNYKPKHFTFFISTLAWQISVQETVMSLFGIPDCNGSTRISVSKHKILIYD